MEERTCESGLLEGESIFKAGRHELRKFVIHLFNLAQRPCLIRFGAGDYNHDVFIATAQRIMNDDKVANEVFADKFRNSCLTLIRVRK